MKRILSVLLVTVLAVLALPVTSWAATPIETTPAKYIFNLASGSRSDFILLDKDDDGAGGNKFLIMYKPGFPRMAFDSANAQKFDPDSSTNIAYIMKEALEIRTGAGGNAYYNHLNALAQYMLDTMWETEVGLATPPSTVTCKLALLSQAEYTEYADKVGYNENKALTENWWLRTPSGANSAWAMTVGNDAGALISQNTTNPRPIRPIFWVNDDFFRSVRINVTTLSSDSEVTKTLKECYSVEDIQDIYTDEEVKTLGFVPTPGRPTPVLPELPELPRTTPLKYLFKLASGDDKEYILLDEESDGEGGKKFYVMRKDQISAATTWGATQKFDLEDTTSIAYRMNNRGTAAENLYYTALDAWRQYMLDTTWEIEPLAPPAPPAPAPIPTPYCVTCKVAFLSQIEYVSKYVDKIGYAETGNHWWLRTPNFANSGQAMTILSTDGAAVGASTGGARHVRPVFWLNDDFFKKVKIDLDSLSSDSVIPEILLNNYSKMDLGRIYSNEELVRIGYDREEIGYEIKFDVSGNTLTVDILKMAVDSTLPGVITAVIAAYDSSGNYLKSRIEVIRTDKITVPAGDEYAMETYSYTMNNVPGAVSYKGYIFDNIFSLKLRAD